MVLVDTHVIPELMRSGSAPAVLDWFGRLIAAIGRAHGAPLATWNARDFEGCGIDPIDPWEAR